MYLNIDGYLVNLQILCEVLEIEMIIFQNTYLDLFCNSM